MSSSKQVGIIGFGLMGAQIAQVFALSGYSVKGYDVSPEQLRSGIDLIRSGKYGLDASVAKGRITKDLAESAFSRISTVHSIEEASMEVELVLEAAIEDMATKVLVFRKASDASGKSTVLASNTSTLSIGKISESLPGEVRSRLAGMHFFNPPQVMKLVEIIKSDYTNESVVARLQQISEDLGKTGIVVSDIPGFVANRIGISVFAEASSLLENKIANVRDIDLAMRLGYGYPMGPFELGDQVGLDSRLRNMKALYEETRDERFKPPEMLEKLVKDGYLGDPKTKKGSKGGYYEYFGLKKPSET